VVITTHVASSVMICMLILSVVSACMSFVSVFWALTFETLE